jgi:hypothetical protein
MGILKSGLAGLALTVILAATVVAQPAPTRRISGTIEKADGGSIVVKPQSGDALTVHLVSDVKVFDVSKGGMDSLKANAFVGVGAMPQADGSQRAMQIVVFDETQRGAGEGFRPWDRGPNSTMTNGTVDTRVGSVDGPKLTVKYKGGEQTIRAVRCGDSRVFGRQQKRAEARREDRRHWRQAAAGRLAGGEPRQCREG